MATPTERMEANRADLEMDLQKLKEIKESIGHELLKFRFTDIFDAIDETIAEKEWWLDDINNSLKVEYALSVGIDNNI